MPNSKRIFSSLFRTRTALFGGFAVITALFIGLVYFTLPSKAANGINNQINYQARLMDSSEFPVSDGTYSIIFSLYDAPTGGTRIWTATGTTAAPTALDISVSNGLFTISLGDGSAAGGWQNSLDSVNWDTDNIYLGVTIGADSEMTPRKRLAAAPQAFNSRQLQGMYASGTAFGANSLFSIHQTSNTAATGTRTALEVRSSGTSSTGDYLIRTYNDLGSAVFTINREGNITSDGYLTVSGATTSTFAHAVSSTRGEYSLGLTVGGRDVCLDDGTNCLAGAENDTLATVSNRGNFATSSLLFYGGATASTFTATSTLTANGNVILGDASADTITFNGRVASSLVPDTDIAYSFGTSALRFQDAWFGGTVTSTDFRAQVSTSTFTTAATHAVGDGPYHVFVSEGYAYVANANDDTFSIIDVSVPGSPSTVTTTSVGDAPDTVFVSGGYAYVGNQGDATISILDISNPATVSTVATYTVPSAAVSLYVSGRYLYTTGYFLDNFSIIDISDPSNPVTLSTHTVGDFPRGMSISDGYAYMVNEGDDTMSIVDVTDPLNPTTVTTTNVGDLPRWTHISNDHIYVTNRGDDNLMIFDITNPASPSLVATQSVGGDPFSVSVSGRYAYVANNASGTVSVIDISNPSSPVDISTHTVGGTPFSVFVSGRYAYVPNNGDDTLSIIEIGGVETNGLLADAASIGNLSVFGSGSIADQLFIGQSLSVGSGGIFSAGGISISDPFATSTFVGAVSTTRLRVNGQQVCLEDGTNCLAGSENDTLATVSNRGNFATSSLLFYGGATASTFTATSTLTANGNVVLGDAAADTITFNGRVATDILPDTDLAYSLGSASLRWDGYFGSVTTTNLSVLDTFNFSSASGSSLDLLTPTAPTGLSVANTTGTAMDVYVSNGYAYVADLGSGLQIFNVNDPATPVFTSGTSLGVNEAWEVVVQGRYAYVAYESAGLRIYDISNPSSPLPVGSFTTSCRAIGLYVSGGYAYVGCDTAGGFRVIDISDPTNPTLAGSLALSSTQGVYVQGEYAYTANGADGLRVIDIGDPTAPVNVGTLNTTGSAHSVSVSGKYAYIADNTNGLVVADISDPTDPTEVANLPFSGGVAWALDIAGNYAYVGNFGDGMRVVDISDPTNPVLVATYDDGANLMRGVHVLGKHAYLASSAAGLRIVDLQGADISTARIGDLQAGSASVVQDLEVGNNLFVRNALNLGFGGLHSNGSIVVSDGNVTSTFRGAVSTTRLRVNGQKVCLADGTNCIAGGSGDTNWTYVAASDFVRNNTSTTDIVLGSTATSTGAPAYFDLAGGQTGTSNFYLGHATNANLIVGGTSTTVSHMNSAFALNGNDLYVSGNIGSASSVYTNGEFVAGAASTHFGDGFITATGTTNLITVRAEQGSKFINAIDNSLTGDFVFDLVATTTPANRQRSIRIRDGYMYALVDDFGTERFDIFDLSDPVSPTSVGSYTFGGFDDPRSFEIQGNYAYVVAQFTGLYILDISDPTNPALVDTVTSPFSLPITDVEIDGNRAYVVSASSGLGNGRFHVIDITDPANATTTATITGMNLPAYMAKDGNHVYVAENLFVFPDSYRAMSIIDVSNPEAPFISATTSLSDSVNAMYARNGTVYLALNGGTVASYDVTSSTNPVLLDSFASGSSFSSGSDGLDVSGRYMFLPHALGRISVVDIADPNNLSTVLQLPASGTFTLNDPVVHGKYLYVTDSGTAQISIYENPGLETNGLVAANANIGTLRVSDHAFFSGKLEIENSLYVRGDINAERAINVLSSATSTFYGGVSTTRLTVNGQQVCLADGTNCSGGGGGGGTSNWVYSSTGDFLRPSTSTDNIVIGGTSTTVSHMNSQFTMDGGDLYVSGNIGSASSVYTNGAFVAGPGSTYFGNGFINKNDSGALTISAVDGVDLDTSLDLVYGSNAPMSVTDTVTINDNPRHVKIQGDYAYIVNSASQKTLSVVDISNPGSASTTATVNIGDGFSGQWTDIDVSGNYAYVSIYNDNSLNIIDVSNPSAPVEIAVLTGLSGASAVRVSGNYAYVSGWGSNELSVVDISDPANPVEISTISSSSNVWYHDVFGDYVYTVSYIDTPVVGVINVSDPENPVLNSTLTLTGIGLGSNYPRIAAEGGYVYIGDSEGNDLVILDVKDPSDPKIMSSSAITGGPSTIDRMRDISINGRYLYAVEDNASAEVHVIDVLDRNNPVHVQSFDIGESSAFGIDVSGNIAAVTQDAQDELKVIDLGGLEANALLAHSAKLGDVNITGRANIQNTLSVGAGISVGAGGVQSIGALSVYATNTTSTFAGGLSVKGQGVCLTDGTGCQVLTDVTYNSVTTSWLSFDNASGTDLTLHGAGNITSLVTGAGTNINVFKGIYVMDKYLYLANDPLSMQVYDVSDPTAPVQVGTSTAVGDLSQAFVAGSYAYYAAGANGLAIFDISDPANPTLAGSNDPGGSDTCESIWVSGRYAYVPCQLSGLRIFDISNPTNPTLAGTYNSPGNAWDVYVRDNIAYLADGGTSFYVIDVSTPSSPTLLGTYTNGAANMRGVSVVGSTAYLGGYSAGIIAVDVSSSTNPTFLGSYDNGRAEELKVAGDYAYVVDSQFSDIDIIDITDPTNLTLAKEVNSSAGSVFIQGQYLYAASNGGINIWKMGGVKSTNGIIDSLLSHEIWVDQNVHIGNDLYVRSGMHVGRGGIVSEGGINVQGSSSLGGVSASSVSVGGVSVCLADGTNCPASSDLNWVYDSGNNLVRNATQTTDILFGGVTPANGGAAYFDLSGGTNGTSTVYFGYTTNTNVVVGGSAITGHGLHSQFVMNGNDFLVNGNIGSVSSIYTNGAFVAGTGTTMYADGSLTKTNGNFTLDISGGFLLPSADLGVSLGSSALKFNGYFGNVTSTGNVTLGDAASDLISINGSINTDLLPPLGTVYSIGNSTNPWDGYFRNVTATNLFVASGGIDILPPDTFYPDADLLATSTIIGGAPKGIHVQGRNLISISGTTDAIEVVDFSDPTNPYLVASSTLGAGVGPTEFVVENDLLILAGDFSGVDGLRMYDIRDLHNPVNVGEIDLSHQAVTDVDAAGVHAYAISSVSSSMYIVNLGDPSRPRLVDTLTGIGTPSDIKVQGNYAYITEQTTEELMIIDISDPTNAVEVGSVVLPTINPYDVQVQGNRVYVSYQNATSFSTVDVSDPTAPFVVGTTTCAGTRCNDSHIAGDLMVQKGYYVLNQSRVIRMMDISSSSTPDTITELEYVKPSAGIEFLHKVGDLVVVIQSDTIFGAPTSSVTIIDTGGVVTDGIRSAFAELGTGSVRTDLQIGQNLTVGSELSVGGQGISSRGGITVHSTGSHSILAGQLTIGDMFGEDEFTNIYQTTIYYPDAVIARPGLCLDNVNTAATCPNSLVSISADDAINASAFDLAEVYSVSGPSAPGDVLVLDSTTSTTVTVSSGVPYDKKVIGVVSTKPGLLLGWNEGAKVALAGRVPTKVNLTNGDIAVGDPLTSSGVAGQAMKATKPGMILGYALEDTSATGTIEMFVDTGYWAGDILTTDGLISELADDLTFAASDTADASTTLVDSWGLTFRGEAWNASASSTVNQSFTLATDILSTTSSRFTIQNSSGTNAFSVNQEGDVTISGKLYPSARGVAQNDIYIFVDDTLAPTSTYISTNADGWQSLDTYDFAERYPSSDNLEPGDLVVVKDSGTRHVQRAMNDTDMVLGIVSTRPAFIAGRPGDDQYPIALSGRVPTKVSGMNGAIFAGDALAPSSIPGVAVKAVKNGPMVGIALDDYDIDQVGEIEVFVNPGWWGGAEGDSEGATGSGTGSVAQGFASIASGATKVSITFPSIGSYPNVFVTPQGQAGEWWTGNYSDQGFEIILAAPLPRDVMFSWTVQPLLDGNILYYSDGTNDILDPLTGAPVPREEDPQE